MKISSRASSLARSSPTPQTDVTGAASGEAVVSGNDIGRTIQIIRRRLNAKAAGRVAQFWNAEHRLGPKEKLFDSNLPRRCSAFRFVANHPTNHRREQFDARRKIGWSMAINS